MRLQAITITIVTCALLAASGCVPKPEMVRTLPQLIDDHNANASQIRHLWTRAKVEVTLVNDDGLTVKLGSVSPTAAPNALLLLEKTTQGTNFVLIGRETAAIELFRVGQSQSEGIYYFWYRVGERAGAYYGRTELAGAPGIDDIPLNPKDLLSVLAISELPTDLTQLPAVTMHLEEGKDSYAYVLSHVARQAVSGQILATQETRLIWSDTEDPDPTEITYFRPSGEAFMNAQLFDIKEVESDSPTNPHMPTRMDITWPSTKTGVTKLRLNLSEMSTTKEFDSSVFEFVLNAPAMSADQIIQIDRHLNEGSR